MVATMGVAALPRVEAAPLALPSAVLKDCPEERLSISVGLEALERESVSDSWSGSGLTALVTG